MKEVGRGIALVIVIIVAWFVAWQSGLYVFTMIMDTSLPNGPHGDLIETYTFWKMAVPAAFLTMLVTFSLIVLGGAKLGEWLFDSRSREGRRLGVDAIRDLRNRELL